MFLVGGGILTHGVPAAHAWIEQVEHAAHALPAGALLAPIAPIVINVVTGLLAGALILLIVSAATAGVRKLRRKAR
jgi:predicted DNA repair protein MutK